MSIERTITSYNLSDSKNNLNWKYLGESDVYLDGRLNEVKNDELIISILGPRAEDIAASYYTKKTKTYEIHIKNPPVGNLNLSVQLPIYFHIPKETKKVLVREDKSDLGFISEEDSLALKLMYATHQKEIGKEFYLAVYRRDDIVGMLGEITSGFYFWPNNFDFKEKFNLESITKNDGTPFKKPKEALEHYLFKLEGFVLNNPKPFTWTGTITKKYDHNSKKIVDVDYKVFLQPQKDPPAEKKLTHVRSI
ncbi:hypothetical protein HZA97_03075 [Candidatus Woesearchaeota archaeon]|nr:hypothetical protein [Candidatus Woesearchaeota archaeon]